MNATTHALLDTFDEYLRKNRAYKTSTSLQYKAEIGRLLRITTEKNCALDVALGSLAPSGQVRAKAALGAWKQYLGDFQEVAATKIEDPAEAATVANVIRAAQHLFNFKEEITYSSRVIWAWTQLALGWIHEELHRRPTTLEMAQRSGTPRQLWHARGVDATPAAVLSALDWRDYTVFPVGNGFHEPRILLQRLGDARPAAEWNNVFSIIYANGGWQPVDAQDGRRPRPFIPVEPRSLRALAPGEVKRLLSASPFVFRDEMPPE